MAFVLLSCFLPEKGLCDIVDSYRRAITLQDILRENSEKKELTWGFNDPYNALKHNYSMDVNYSGVVFKLNIKEEIKGPCGIIEAVYEFFSVKDQLDVFDSVISCLVSDGEYEAMGEFNHLEDCYDTVGWGVFKFLKTVSEQTLLSLFYGLLDVAHVGRFVKYLPDSDDE